MKTNTDKTSSTAAIAQSYSDEEETPISVSISAINSDELCKRFASTLSCLDDSSSNQSESCSSSSSGSYLNESSLCASLVDSEPASPTCESPSKAPLLKLLYGVCGKSKRSQAPLINKNSFSLERGNFGDDAGFTCDKDAKFFFGIADGVSGNAKKGVDARLFPTALMNTCKRLLMSDDEPNEFEASLFELLCAAHGHVQQECVYGSSTVCLVSIGKSDGVMSTLNLGDSGYMIVRDGSVMYKSVAQSHRYNAPYQIGCTPPELSDVDLYRDLPEDSICLKHRVKLGDFVVLSSDGLFDNLYEDEIAQIINSNIDGKKVTHEILNVISQQLVEKASEAGIKRDDILLFLIYVSNELVEAPSCEQ